MYHQSLKARVSELSPNVRTIEESSGNEAVKEDRLVFPADLGGSKHLLLVQIESSPSLCCPGLETALVVQGASKVFISRCNEQPAPRPQPAA